MSYGRIYTVGAGGLTLANQAVTLAFINPKSSGLTLEIIHCWCGQTGETTSAQQRIQLVTQVTSFPTLTSATPRPHDVNEQASEITGGTAGANGTAGVNASAEGAGAKTVIVDDVFNNLYGWERRYPTGEGIRVNQKTAAGFGIFLPAAAPGGRAGWSVGITYREL